MRQRRPRSWPTSFEAVARFTSARSSGERRRREFTLVSLPRSTGAGKCSTCNNVPEHSFPTHARPSLKQWAWGSRHLPSSGRKNYEILWANLVSWATCPLRWSGSCWGLKGCMLITALPPHRYSVPIIPGLVSRGQARFVHRNTRLLPNSIRR